MPRRRTYLKTAGTALFGSLAGCMGNEGNGEQSNNGNGGQGNGNGNVGSPSDDRRFVTFGVIGDGSTFAFAQGLTGLLNEYSDAYEYVVEPVSNLRAGPIAVDDGRADITPITNQVMRKINLGEQPFNAIETDFAQLFNFYDLYWTYMTTNSDWESIEDITNGSSLSPGPRGGDGRESLLRILEEYAGLDDYVSRSVAWSEQGSAFNQGQLDVGSFSLVNGPGAMPGWMQETTNIADVRVLDIPDNIVQDVREDPSIFLEIIEPTEDIKSNFAFIPDELPTPVNRYSFVASQDLEQEVVDDLMQTAFSHREELQEYHAGWGVFFADAEYWTASAFEDVAFHSAAANLYQAEGIWQDDFQST